MDNLGKTNWQVMIEHYVDRMKDIKKREELDPLCIDEELELNITLSTGGPSDGFKLYVDKRTREPIRGCYYYSNWFWYEEEWLKSDEVDLIAEFFSIY